MSLGNIPAELPEQQWRWVTAHLPIACVDVLPVTRDQGRRITHVGLILRDSPMGERWCHLGGRILYDETLNRAARRHLGSLHGGERGQLGAEPFFCQQYFPEPREGMGVDPRKHAVALCFLAEYPQSISLEATGDEAKRFAWFAAGDTPAAEELWPGTDVMIHRALACAGWSDEIASYEALAARCTSHNELMWQTPVVAMTAMAFLLTIGLGDAEDWKRALAGALSAMIAVICAQLMAKHSRSQLADADALWAIELHRGMRQVHRPPGPSSREGRLRSWLASKKSRDWWFVSLMVFALVSSGISILAVFGA